MGRIYLDIGTGEGEAHVKNIQHLRDLLLSQGYLPGQELMYLEEEGAGHEEAAWARRFPQVLSFFMAPTHAPSTAS
jgi:hypothetical protein